MGRRPIGATAMTDAERQQWRRAKAKALRVSPPAQPTGPARKAPRGAPDILVPRPILIVGAHDASSQRDAGNLCQ